VTASKTFDYWAFSATGEHSMKTIIYGALAASVVAIAAISLAMPDYRGTEYAVMPPCYENYSYGDTPQYDYTDSGVEYSKK
jgi:hypothetical protein